MAFATSIWKMAGIPTLSSTLSAIWSATRFISGSMYSSILKYREMIHTIRIEFSNDGRISTTCCTGFVCRFLKCRSKVVKNFTLSFASACIRESSENWSSNVVTRIIALWLECLCKSLSAACTPGISSCSYKVLMLLLRSRHSSISAMGYLFARPRCVSRRTEVSMIRTHSSTAVSSSESSSLLIFSTVSSVYRVATSGTRMFTLPYTWPAACPTWLLNLFVRLWISS
mmetsp:Transcript_26211/g.65997  ORF Transcript_26211/g.65997 Transcript_26211/m.65997 type:complete len:228 (-) Transcript_26211:1247-1930(-)